MSNALLKEVIEMLDNYGTDSMRSYKLMKGIIAYYITESDMSIHANSILIGLRRIESFDSRLLYLEFCINYLQIGGCHFG